MDLSSDLVTEFIKATNDKQEDKKETTVYGTVREVNGLKYVQIDGSSILTPVSFTTNINQDDRVTIMIKNHIAVVTGNLTSPSANNRSIKEDIDAEVKDIYSLVAEKATIKELDVERGRIQSLEVDNVQIKKDLEATNIRADNIEADTVEIHKELNANSASIENLKVTKLDAEIADIKYAHVEDLEATDAKLYSLTSTYGTFADLTTKHLEANDADIDNLKANKLDVTFANIDFSNIEKAVFEQFYATSGLIENVTIGDATITGRLVGVTISGDLVEAGTLVAEKIVIKGEDGLYYKLNTDGETVTEDQTDYNSLNGKVITAKSVTAEKISVDDLVAFDATIGGINITDGSIYSGVKSSVSNTTQGVYLDKEGQMSLGDESQFIRYYKDQNGEYKLEIQANNIVLGASSENIGDGIIAAKGVADEALGLAVENEERVSKSEAQIELIDGVISNLVTDSNGSSMMTQSSSGWTFNIGAIENTLEASSIELKSLSDTTSGMTDTISKLDSLINDLSEKTAYIIMTTDENGDPCIELGKQDEPFKVRITNTSVDFMEDSLKVAYVNNKTLFIEKATVKGELQIGDVKGFTWKKRSNGNMGLRWVE